MRALPTAYYIAAVFPKTQHSIQVTNRSLVAHAEFLLSCFLE